MVQRMLVARHGGSLPAQVDVLVVGSGPAGATVAREIHDAVPGATVLIVEAGPPLPPAEGANVRNLPPEQRRPAQERATSWTGQDSSDTGRAHGRIVARPGTFLLRPPVEDDDDQTGMPAAALAANVGGMGAHWTCASPPPGGSERIGLVEDVFDEAFARASALLHATSDAFPVTEAGERLRRTLAGLFDEGRPAHRRVQSMPLACTPTGGPLPRWSGVDTILADTLADPSGTVGLVHDTVCTRLIHEGMRVTGAVLRDRQTAEVVTVFARTVVVAADALRTPQLLWTSGIRPPALGRYLNDQPQIVSALALREHDDGVVGVRERPSDRRDLLTGVLWIPFHDPGFPFHTQVMQVGTTPIELPGEPPKDRPVVTWGRFTTKEIRAEDRLEFSDSELDPFGLPKITIHYGLTEGDRQTIDRAMRELVEQAESVGDFFPGSRPRLLPAGSSMHYQGTVRMGESDDGASVCDRHSRVWGYDNLYVAGNGVIPTATACNPTATTVALAVLAARHLVATQLGADDPIGASAVSSRDPASPAARERRSA